MIIKVIKYIIIFSIISVCTSCDILRLSSFEVTKWSPGTGYHADPVTLLVSVSFSHDPDRESVEKNFSFTGDGEAVRGVFQWRGKKLNFLPYAPLETNKDYCVRISQNAQDKKMISMDREFEGSFTTRPGTERPNIVSFTPSMEGVMESRGTVVISFSCPISLDSLRGNASFTPSMSGTWRLDEAGTLAVFTPAEPWPQGKRFEFRLPTSLEGINGMATGKNFFSIFYIGEDRTLPYLTGVWRLTADGEEEELVSEPLGEFVENAGWEKDDRLLLQFSREVDLLSAGTALTAENASSLVLVPSSSQTGFDSSVVFRFDKPPAYENRFFVRLKKGVKDMHGNESTDEHLFRIFANGENSKPPSLVGIRIPMSPGGFQDIPPDPDPDDPDQDVPPDTDPDDPDQDVPSDPDPDDPDFRLHAYSVDQLFDDLPVESTYYPYNTKTLTWIECYFDHAPGAVIDLFSIMENFRIETSNNVLTFTPLVIRNSGFTVTDPHPEWEGYQRLEIGGNLTNTVNTGLVHFLFNKGIKDSAGNSSENQFRISLIK
jgi:hypothetical protein